MLSLRFDALRWLVGVAGRLGFHRSRPAEAASAGPGSHLIYRLRAWPELPEAERTADVYRLLSVMSSRPVNLPWMLARVRMEPQQLEDLLRQWAAEGALEVIDPRRFPAPN